MVNSIVESWKNYPSSSNSKRNIREIMSKTSEFNGDPSLTGNKHPDLTRPTTRDRLRLKNIANAGTDMETKYQGLY